MVIKEKGEKKNLTRYWRPRDLSKRGLLYSQRDRDKFRTVLSELHGMLGTKD